MDRHGGGVLCLWAWPPRGGTKFWEVASGPHIRDLIEAIQEVYDTILDPEGILKGATSEIVGEKMDSG